MIWTRPWALSFLAAALGAAALYVAAFRWKTRARARLGDPLLLDTLTDPGAPRRQKLKGVFSVAAAALLALALAGPRGGRAYQDARRRGVDVVIAIDVSASMLAEDVKPSRLVQAKRELGLLIDGLDGDRVGIVAFAGAAFLQCPLTLDYAAARSLLDLVDPDLIPVPGTNIAAALETALNAFPAGGRKHKAVVLLTDGEDHSGRLDEAVRRAADEGARVYAVGLGSPAGEVIPIRDENGAVTDYKKDKSGRTVVSKLGEAALQDMAAKTGGAYFRAGPSEGEIDRILGALQGLEKKTFENRLYDHTQDRYRWPLGLALCFLVLEFLWPETWPGASGFLRKIIGGTASALALLLLAASPLRAAGRKPGNAAARRAAEGWRRIVEQKPGDADAQFNLGQASYRAADFPGAADAFGKAQGLYPDPQRQALAAYDAATALARAGKLDEALEKYKDAMRRSPDDLDAKHNYETLLKERKNGGKGQEKQGPGKPSSAGAKPAPDGGDDAKKSPAPGSLSREDAERILQTVERQEKDARRHVKAPADGRPPTGEDW